MSNRNPTILIISGARGDTRRYRCFHLYEQLMVAGVNCHLAQLSDPNLAAEVAQASIVIIHRGAYDPYLDRLFKMMHQRNILAIYDIDDFIFDPIAFDWINSPELKGSIRAALFKEDMQRYGLTLRQCTGVFVSTDYLAQQVQGFGKSVWVHRNAFSLEMLQNSEKALRSKRPNDGKLIIGYASGTPTHNRDFEVAKPALQRILRRYPQVDLQIIGPLDPGDGWGSLQERVTRIDWVPWRELPGRLAQFDINIAPLVESTPFGQSKSEIKYVESGLVKVPTIASQVDAYQYAIRHGENGFLASSEEDWVDTLAQLIERTDLRRSMMESAYTDVMEKYHPKTRAQELVDTLDRLYQEVLGKPLWVAGGGPQPRQHPVDVDPKWLTPYYEGKPAHYQMAYYYLRYRDLRTFLALLWVYFRRLLAPVFPFKSG